MDTETYNSVLCTITVRIDDEHAKLSCAPLNQYKAMLCTTKVDISTELISSNCDGARYDVVSLAIVTFVYILHLHIHMHNI